LRRGLQWGIVVDSTTQYPLIVKDKKGYITFHYLFDFMALSERIRAVRRQLGLTQQEFAELFDTSQKVVSRWEAGVRPRETTLQRIADAGDVTYEWLTGRQQDADTAASGVSNESGHALIEGFSRLNRPRRQILLAFLAMLGRLQRTDRSNEWMEELSGAGRIPLSAIEQMREIYDLEWEVLGATLRLEKELLAAEQPQGNEQARESKRSRQSKALKAQETRIDRLKARLEDKMKELAELWDDVPQLD
jgi:transcriptional regulator with XRE-family HTH domain